MPEWVVRFYDACSAPATASSSHLTLFGMPEDPAERVAQQDVIYVERRQHGEHARDLARARHRPRAARGLGARRRPRRHERRAPTAGSRTPSPTRSAASCASCGTVSASCRRASARTTTARPSGGRPTRGSSATASSARLRGRRRRGVPLRGHRAARGRQPARGRARLSGHGQMARSRSRHASSRPSNRLLLGLRAAASAISASQASPRRPNQIGVNRT